MPRTVRTIIFSLFLAFLAISPSVQAQPSGESPYVVRDVKVDIIAKSAVKAREQAFGEAQVKAFDMLLARFVAPEEIANFSKPEPQVIAGLVQDFELQSEQTSSRRYIGTFTFRFKEHATDRFFGHGPIGGFVQSVRSGVLVLPFYQDGESQYLWDARNIWFKAWSRVQNRADNPLGDDVVLPVGDVSDLMDIQNGQALSDNMAAIKRLKARYGASDSVIAIAVPQANPQSPLIVQLYRTDLKKPELGSTITLSLTAPANTDQIMDRAVEETLSALRQNWKTAGAAPTDLVSAPSDAAQAQPSAGMEPPLYDAQTAALIRGQAAPEAAPVVQAPSPAPAAVAPIRATARFRDMNQWFSMQQNLRSLPGLSGLRIVRLSRQEATVDLTYSGSPQQLQGQLSGRGITLVGGNGAYQLLPAGI